MNLPKQSIHRLCQTLLAEGYLIRDANPKKLRPARRTRRMASGLLSFNHQYIARHQILERVSKSIGETVNFVVAEAEGMTYLDRVETNWAFRIQLPVGSHVPFHCTASGKTFLASLGIKERRSLVEHLELNPMSVNTITDKQLLLNELEQVERQGYAVDNIEFFEDMIAIAVPIVDAKGNFCAALGCHCPIQRMELKQLISYVSQLQIAALSLADLLFDT